MIDDCSSLTGSLTHFWCAGWVRCRRLWSAAERPAPYTHLRGGVRTSVNPKGILAAKPRVARHELPWARMRSTNHNPERVVAYATRNEIVRKPFGQRGCGPRAAACQNPVGVHTVSQQHPG